MAWAIRGKCETPNPQTEELYSVVAVTYTFLEDVQKNSVDIMHFRMTESCVQYRENCKQNSLFCNGIP
jgi:hypothetical protein